MSLETEGSVNQIELPSGASVWSRSVGDGPGLLHIHGSGLGHANFDRLTPQLTDAFTVTDFDLPGFGLSRKGKRGTDPASLADEVADFARALGYTQIHVHGTSFGALVALVLAARHPEVVDRVILSAFLARYDAAARALRGTWKRAARDSGTEFVGELTAVAGFSRSYFDGPDAAVEIERMRNAFGKTEVSALVAAVESLERADFSADAARIEAPVMMMVGDEDTMTPLRPAGTGVGIAQLATIVRNAETVVVPGAGHYVVIEQPQVVAEHVKRFLYSA